MSLRVELLSLASQEGANFAELCRRFGVSRETGYKWRRRLERDGPAALADRSRRPRRSPRQTPHRMESLVLSVRDEHPAWGGRKIRALLLAQGHRDMPAASTITEILRRHGRLQPDESAKRRPFQRFERAAPNDLWQMDFKGHFAIGNGKRCHPLTVLDDHSRYAIGLRACGNERSKTVRQQLTVLFKRYGLPQAMLMDNGSPWGVPHAIGGGYTRLTAWLLRLSVRVCHGRPYHPQTQGKDERFHRTLQVELLRDSWYRSLREAQREFDPWRQMYNSQRPHEALDLNVPASRYRPSPRPMPDRLPPLEYGADVLTRTVKGTGQVQFQDRYLRVSEAFVGDRIGFRPTRTDGVYYVLYGSFRIGRADLRGTRRGKTAEVASARSARFTEPPPTRS